MKKLLALSGSQREASTNSALLQALKNIASERAQITIYEGIGTFPIFNPDREGANTPSIIQDFKKQILEADGLIVACPEYAHGIPGGLKNALDWLVSVEGFSGKPVMIAHASRRGGFVLDALQEVLSTMDATLVEEAFLRLPVMSKTPEEIDAITSDLDAKNLILDRLSTFIQSIGEKIDQ